MHVDGEWAEKLSPAVIVHRGRQQREMNIAVAGRSPDN
jgi:hypothetical protein